MNADAVPESTASGYQGGWLVVRPDTTFTGPAVLTLPRSGMQSVTVYAPPLYAGVTRRFADAWEHADQLSTHVSERASQFSADAPFLLRLDQPLRGLDAVQVREESDHLRWQYRRGVLLASFRAIVVAMIVINFFVWIRLREKTYRLYVGYLSTLLLFMALTDGSFYSTDLARFVEPFHWRVRWLTGCVGAALVIAFARVFGAYDIYSPRLSRALRLGANLFLFFAACAFIPAEGIAKAVRLLGNTMIPPFSLLILAAGVNAVRGGSRYAAFFLIGWTPLTVVTIYRALAVQNLLPDHSDSIVWMHGAVVVESLVFSLGLADRALSMRVERDRALALADQDPLTGVLNRRGLDIRLKTLFSDDPLSLTPIAVLFVDIDHFKQVNDRWGHDAGDEVLQAAASLLKKRFAQRGLVARYGGEELVVALPGFSASDAMGEAEAFRVALEQSSISRIPVTASIGVAALSPAYGSADELVALADQAMYLAKSRGRNQVALQQENGHDTKPPVPAHDSGS